MLYQLSYRRRDDQLIAGSRRRWRRRGAVYQVCSVPQCGQSTAAVTSASKA